MSARSDFRARTAGLALGLASCLWPMPAVRADDKPAAPAAATGTADSPERTALVEALRAAAQSEDGRALALAKIEARFGARAVADLLADTAPRKGDPSTELGAELLGHLRGPGKRIALQVLAERKKCQQPLFDAIARLAEWEAFDAARRGGLPQGTEPIEGVLMDRAWRGSEDAATVVRSIGAFGTKRSAEGLSRLITSGDTKSGMPRAAADALYAIASRDADPNDVFVPLFMSVSSGKPGPDDMDHCLACVVASGASRGNMISYLESLAPRLRPDHRDLRREIYVALGRMNTRESVEALLRHADDKLKDAKLESERLALWVWSLGPASLLGTDPALARALLNFISNQKDGSFVASILERVRVHTGLRELKDAAQFAQYVMRLEDEVQKQNALPTPAPTPAPSPSDPETKPEKSESRETAAKDDAPASGEKSGKKD